MKTKNSKVGGMKTSNINIRLRDDLREKAEYLKLLPGGITAWVERQLETVEVDRELMEKLKKLRG